MPSNVMDPESDAPGADDDASGTAVSVRCARLLSGGSYRATLLFAAACGEEQGLLGRGGDHRPFTEAGLPAVRFTEPLENYDHEHQTPPSENGREYGDLLHSSTSGSSETW